jgi:hypothetical protein
LFFGAFSTLCFVWSVINGKTEQCICIKFCLKPGKSATETAEMLREAFGERYLSWTGVTEWHSRFKNGQGSDEDDESQLDQASVK